MMNEYSESGSFPQGDMASGPPPNQTVPTIKLAAKNGRRISFQQENKDHLRRDDTKPATAAPQR
jgi:hypothetical protein